LPAVLIAFDDADKAMASNNSAAQKEINAARKQNADSHSFLVGGVAN
jgi:uncharacterized protein (DUF1330 family)